MKILTMAILAGALVSSAAMAQNYGAAHFSSLTLDAPLAVTSGGTGNATGAADGLTVLGRTLGNSLGAGGVTASMLASGSAAANLGAAIGTNGATIPLLSTANTWSAVQAFNGGVTISTPSGLTQALNTQQSVTGAQTTPYTANMFNIISDTLNTHNSFVDGFAFQDVLYAGHGGGRQVLNSSFIIDGTPTTGTLESYVAFVPVAINNGYNLNGTGTTWNTSQGGMFVLNPYIDVKSGATNLQTVTGAEVDVALEAGASSEFKFGWQIVELTTDAVHAGDLEAAFEVRSMTGAIGWNNGLMFDDQLGHGQFPISSGGTVISAKCANTPCTVTSGLDFSALNITGNALNFANATLTGAGNLTLTDAAQYTGLSINNASHPVGALIGLATGNDGGTLVLDYGGAAKTEISASPGQANFINNGAGLTIGGASAASAGSLSLNAATQYTGLALNNSGSNPVAALIGLASGNDGGTMVLSYGGATKTEISASPNQANFINNGAGLTLGGTTATIAGGVQYATIYSAAGTPLPTCTTSLKATKAFVSDATSPTYHGTYTSGGAVVSPVYCNGSAWLTD